MSKEDKKIDSLLKRSDKGMDDCNNILSKLLRCILADLNIGPTMYNNLLSYFIRNVKDIKFDRGNFNKLILNDSMTWNGFIQALAFLRVTRLKLTIEIERKGIKYPTVHSIEVNDVTEHVVKKRTKVQDHY